MTEFRFDRLLWLNDPTCWGVEDSNGDLEGSQGSYTIDNDGKQLTLFPPAKKDFWARTFYTPLLLKHDASALVSTVPANDEVTIRLDFEYHAISQFDQAGLLIYLDDNTWVKCGIEYCDGSPRLSVVVCNVFSDWSTQLWDSFGARLKVHKVRQSNSLVVEAARLNTDSYQMVRIAHLSSRSAYNGDDIDSLSAAGSSWEKDWKVGPYAACPIQQRGCKAVFGKFSVGPREESVHEQSL